MAEYIERDAVIALFDSTKWQGTFAIMAVEDLPAADVAPVVHGHWKLSELPYTQGAYVCSECNKIAADSVAGVKPLPPELFGRQIYSYCPYCGAKMDKAVADATD